MNSIAQRWGYWYQRRFQNTERGRHFSKKLLAARSRTGRNGRTRKSSWGVRGGGELLGRPHSQAWTAFPHTLQTYNLPPPGPLCRGCSLPTCPYSHPIYVPPLSSTSWFSAACIHPAWPKAECLTLSTTSVFKTSQMWVQHTLGCSRCICRQLAHPSKVHEVSESEPSLNSTWGNF